MPNRGGLPMKPDDERVRRNAPTFQAVPVEWDGTVRGPDLPGRYSWSRETREWWEEFRRSPQSMVCIDSDWRFLLDTATLVERYWREWMTLPIPHLTSLSAEIRRRLGHYGASFDDRQRQRITVRSPQTEEAEKAEIKAEAAKAVDYMQLLAQEAASALEANHNGSHTPEGAS